MQASTENQPVTRKGSLLAKTASQAARQKAVEIEPFDKRTIELTKAKPELSAKELHNLINPARFSFLAIETLTPIKTVGRGRTNLTLIAPTVFHTDTDGAARKLRRACRRARLRFNLPRIVQRATVSAPSLRSSGRPYLPHVAPDA